MRKIKRRSAKRQQKVIILSVISIMLLLTVGYAAFETNISLNAKGNIKRRPTAINGPVSDLIATKVTTGSGLYDNGDDTYTYKGIDPYNYITFNNELWRIVSISSKGQLKIIKDEKLNDDRVFDTVEARTTGYCSNSAAGCNVWSDIASYTNGNITGEVTTSSELNTYLNGTYYNNLSNKDKVVEADFNIGPSGSESSFTSKSNVALLTESEYTAAGGVTSYLKKSYDYYLLTPAASSASDLKIAGSSIINASASTTKAIRPVVNLTCDIRLTGKGTKNIPFVISSGDGSCSDSSSPYVYAYHTDGRTIGSSTVTDGVSDYTQLSSWQNGKTWFLKYELDGNNVIQNAWACQKFSFINEPVCLQGGDASYYTANRGIIEGLANTFTSNGGVCSAAGNDSYCGVDVLYVYAYSTGAANALVDTPYGDCYVYYDGTVGCN